MKMTPIITAVKSKLNMGWQPGRTNWGINIINNISFSQLMHHKRESKKRHLDGEFYGRVWVLH